MLDEISTQAVVFWALAAWLSKFAKMYKSHLCSLENLSRDVVDCLAGENCSQTCKNLFRFRVIVSDGNKSLKAVAAVAAAGLKIPTGTGPVLPVTGQTGLDWFRFRPVSNRPKFKIQI